MQASREIELGAQTARAWRQFGTGKRGGAALGRIGGGKVRARL